MTLQRLVPIILAAALGACAADSQAVYHTTTIKGTRELVPLAAAAARASGFEVALEVPAAGWLIAINPERTAVMKVAMAKDGHNTIDGDVVQSDLRATMACAGMGGCGTWYTVTPLTVVDHEVVAWKAAPEPVVAEARALVNAIAERAQ